MVRNRRRNLRYLLVLAALVVVLAGGGAAALETDTVGTFGQGVWWALSLTTTVGFVGHPPVTTGGRILAASLMIFGFSLLAAVTAAVAALLVREDEEAFERVERKFDSEMLTELRKLNARLDRLEGAGGATPGTDAGHQGGSK